MAVGFHIFRTLEVNRLMGKLLQQPNMYADFEFLAFWQTQYNNMNAVNLFFAWIKVPWGSASSAAPQGMHSPFPRTSLIFLVWFWQLLWPPEAPGVDCFRLFCFFPNYLVQHGPFRYSSTRP